MTRRSALVLPLTLLGTRQATAQGSETTVEPADPEAPLPTEGRRAWFTVTAYANWCGGLGGNRITASGAPVGLGCIAGPRSLPFGTELYVPGYGYGVVLDRGGAISEGRLDVWMPICSDAWRWGRRRVLVSVLED